MAMPELDFGSALATAGRTGRDCERDATSKPAEVLAFLGVEPD